MAVRPWTLDHAHQENAHVSHRDTNQRNHTNIIQTQNRHVALSRTVLGSAG